MHRGIRNALFGLGGFCTLGVSYCTYAGLLGDNFRVVTAGRFYRSGRMSGPDLEARLVEHGIRRAVNLCGRQRTEWYRDELEICSRLNIRHDNVRMSSRRHPSRDDLRHLIRIFRSGPYPMLVHCGGGADRSGLAAAIYLIVAEGQDVQSAAGEQLTWHYGHLPILGMRNLDRFFQLYEREAAQTDFATWALLEYSPP